MRKTSSCVVLVSLFVSVAALAAEAPHPEPGFAMNEEVRTAVRSFRDVALSPRGDEVIATILDTTANGGEPHLWRLAPGAAPRQLTFARSGAPGGESAPAWSPDGRFVTYIATRDGAKSVFRLPIAGGEAERLQLVRDGANVKASWSASAEARALTADGFSYAPDGAHIAVWARNVKSADEKRREDAKDDAYVHGEEKNLAQVFVVATATMQVRHVPLDRKFHALSWAQDGSEFLIVADDDKDETGPDAVTLRVSVKDLAPQRLDLSRATDNAALLPGGARAAYSAQCEDDTPPGCKDIFVKTLAGGETRNLTRGFDGTFPGNFIVERSGDLLIVVAHHMQNRLARLSTTTGAVTWYDTGRPVVTAVATNPAQNAIAFVASGSTNPAQAFVTRRFGTAPQALAGPAIVPATWAQVPSRLVTWKSDEFTIEGLLYLPPRAAPGAKIPLVVNVHGGPASKFSDSYKNLVQLLAAEGWAVLEPNIRGSTGYGTKFLAANKNDLGGGDYRDVMAGVDAMLREHPIDANRLALIGYSYGGEIAGFAVGRTDRFKAIISGAPVINQFSEYGTEDHSFYDRWYFGQPWVRFADAWRQSPLSYVAGAKTPFLLLQGDVDEVDPLGQSLEMYRALRQVGAPVELIVYPRANHSRAGAHFRAEPSAEPWHGTDMRRRMFGFLRAAFAGEANPLSKAREDKVMTPSQPAS